MIKNKTLTKLVIDGVITVCVCGVVITELLPANSSAATSACATQVVELTIMPERQINVDEKGKIIEIWSNNNYKNYMLWLQAKDGERIMLKDINGEIPAEIYNKHKDILQKYEQISAITDFTKAGLVYKYILGVKLAFQEKFNPQKRQIRVEE
jgi:hypothetical protein